MGMRNLVIVLLHLALALPIVAQDRGIGGTAGTCAYGPRKYAVIIGINEYSDKGISDLGAAVADAQAMYELLGSAPGGFDEARMVLLTDTAGDDKRPTRGTILRYLKSFITLAGEEDTVLVYFAGHGPWRLHALPYGRPHG